MLGVVQSAHLYHVWPNSTQFVRIFSEYLKPHANYLVEVPEVPIYYLQDHPDAQPRQFTSTFYINYRNSKGVLLTGTKGFTAAIEAGYFHIVATSLNEKSAEAAQFQARAIREKGVYAEVSEAYMEEAPFIADWRKFTTQPNVVVVPFFIADGLHSYQDIPVLLGIESAPTAAASQREVFRRNPYHLDGRTLYYASAIGTEPQMADVILDTISRFDEKYL